MLRIARRCRHVLSTELIMQHKPFSFLSPSTQPSRNKRFAVDLLTAKNVRGKWIGPEPNKIPKLQCIGRLDADSTGLMLWTTDRSLADTVKNPSSNIEKDYLVRVKGHESWSDDQRLHLVETMGSGMRLDDGIDLMPADVKWINDDQLQVVIREGKHRQIRRMCAQLGLEVQGIKRVAIGCIRLGGLPSGCWSSLPRALVHQLRKQASQSSSLYPRK